MQLNCSVEKVNPKMTSFTWEYCDPELSTCDPKNDTMWEQIHSDYLTTKVVNLTLSLLLEDQPQDKVVYRCNAENVWGTDQISYKVYKVRGILFKSCTTFLAMFIRVCGQQYILAVQFSK